MPENAIAGNYSGSPTESSASGAELASDSLVLLQTLNDDSALIVVELVWTQLRGDAAPAVNPLTLLLQSGLSQGSPVDEDRPANLMWKVISDAAELLPDVYSPTGSPDLLTGIGTAATIFVTPCDYDGNPITVPYLRAELDFDHNDFNDGVISTLSIRFWQASK